MLNCSLPCISFSLRRWMLSSSLPALPPKLSQITCLHDRGKCYRTSIIQFTPWNDSSWQRRKQQKSSLLEEWVWNEMILEYQSGEACHGDSEFHGSSQRMRVEWDWTSVAWLESLIPFLLLTTAADLTFWRDWREAAHLQLSTSRVCLCRVHIQAFVLEVRLRVKPVLERRAGSRAPASLALPTGGERDRRYGRAQGSPRGAAGRQGARGAAVTRRLATRAGLPLAAAGGSSRAGGAGRRRGPGRARSAGGSASQPAATARPSSARLFSPGSIGPGTLCCGRRHLARSVPPSRLVPAGERRRLASPWSLGAPQPSLLLPMGIREFPNGSARGKAATLWVRPRGGREGPGHPPHPSPSRGTCGESCRSRGAAARGPEGGGPWRPSPVPQRHAALPRCQPAAAVRHQPAAAAAQVPGGGRGHQRGLEVVPLRGGPHQRFRGAHLHRGEDPPHHRLLRLPALGRQLQTWVPAWGCRGWRGAEFAPVALGRVLGRGSACSHELRCWDRGPGTGGSAAGAPGVLISVFVAAVKKPRCVHPHAVFPKGRLRRLSDFHSV